MTGSTTQFETRECATYDAFVTWTEEAEHDVSFTPSVGTPRASYLGFIVGLVPATPGDECNFVWEISEPDGTPIASMAFGRELVVTLYGPMTPDLVTIINLFA